MENERNMHRNSTNHELYSNLETQVYQVWYRNINKISTGLLSNYQISTTKATCVYTAETWKQANSPTLNIHTHISCSYPQWPASPMVIRMSMKYGSKMIESKIFLLQERETPQGKNVAKNQNRMRTNVDCLHFSTGGFPFSSRKRCLGPIGVWEAWPDFLWLFSQHPGRVVKRISGDFSWLLCGV